MTPDEFLALADRPELISGIHNYCDRWCERCPMTSRCIVYLSLEQDDKNDPVRNDLNEDAFWKKIHDSFSLTFQLLARFTKEQNINLDFTAEEKESFAKGRKEKMAATKKEPVIQQADQYIKLGKSWLEHCQETFKRKDAELVQALELGLPNSQPEHEALEIQDAIEVISYYLFQIFVKMMRAYSGRREDDEWFEDNGYPKDSDGSAKVALIGIDRSIEAWSTVLNSFQDQEEIILEILAVLQRLIQMVEKEFPKARFFVRPGFDE